MRTSVSSRPSPSRCSCSPPVRAAAVRPAVAPAVLKPIRLQLQWFPQAQFAGYFAALDKGYYKDEGFDVTILPGAVEIVPATVVAGGQAEFGISWVPRMLAPRESGADGVVIGQIFQRSPTLQVSFKDKNITKPEDLQGQEGRARGASATRPSCTPACARRASTRPTSPTSTSSPSSSTWSPSAPVRSMPPRR